MLSPRLPAIAGSLAAAILAASPEAMAARPSRAPNDGFFYAVQVIAPHIRLIHRPDPLRTPAEGNVTVIEQADGLVVVDAGGAPAAGRRIIAKVRSFSRKPVKTLIYTHWHGDHNLGAPAFRAAYPAMRIVSTAATRADMLGPASAFYAGYGDKFRGVVAYVADLLKDPKLSREERAGLGQVLIDGPAIATAYDEARVMPAETTFTDRLTIDDAAAPVEVVFLGPANTDGDAVVWAPRQRVLITGDIVVSPYPFGTASYPQAWVGVLERLKQYDFARLIPGHGPPQADRAYLDALIGLIEDVRGQVGPLARAGLPLEEVRKRVDFEAQQRRFSGADAWRRRLFSMFFLDPMVECAFKEARGEPISQ